MTPSVTEIDLNPRNPAPEAMPVISISEFRMPKSTPEFRTPTTANFVNSKNEGTRRATRHAASRAAANSAAPMTGSKSSGILIAIPRLITTGIANAPVKNPTISASTMSRVKVPLPFEPLNPRDAICRDFGLLRFPCERPIALGERALETFLATRLHPVLYRVGLMRDHVDIRRRLLGRANPDDIQITIHRRLV